jgi:predicted RNase H-like HicB family nuclease
MPRKIREFKAEIARKGFIYLPKRRKGSHERWQHPLLGKTLTVSGKDGDEPIQYDCPVVTIPEFADRVIMPCTYGKTREEAIHHGEEVIEMYLQAWQAEGESIPEPNILQIA